MLDKWQKHAELGKRYLTECWEGKSLTMSTKKWPSFKLVFNKFGFSAENKN